MLLLHIGKLISIVSPYYSQAIYKAVRLTTSVSHVVLLKVVLLSVSVLTYVVLLRFRKGFHFWK